MSDTTQGQLPINPGAPSGEGPPIMPIVPAFTPPPSSSIAALNAAKALAAENASAAVSILATVMADTELYDTEVRVQAAAELLQFLAKGPF